MTIGSTMMTGAAPAAQGLLGIGATPNAQAPALPGQPGFAGTLGDLLKPMPATAAATPAPAVAPGTASAMTAMALVLETATVTAQASVASSPAQPPLPVNDGATAAAAAPVGKSGTAAATQPAGTAVSPAPTDPTLAPSAISLAGAMPAPSAPPAAEITSDAAQPLELASAQALPALPPKATIEQDALIPAVEAKTDGAAEPGNSAPQPPEPSLLQASLGAVAAPQIIKTLPVAAKAAEAAEPVEAELPLDSAAPPLAPPATAPTGPAATAPAAAPPAEGPQDMPHVTAAAPAPASIPPHSTGAEPIAGLPPQVETAAANSQPASSSEPHPFQPTATGAVDKAESARALPAAPEPHVAARPGQIGRELGVEIARRIAAGGEELVVRLSPQEMGRIEVRMSFDDQGSLRAVMTAESAAALDMLRRDAGDLGRALSDAGVRADSQSLKFDARGGDGHGSQRSFADGESRRHREPQSGGDGLEPEDSRYRPLSSSNHIDLMA